MDATVLLTGPEAVGIIRDVVVVAFLVFAFLALAVFVVLALLLYRRLAALLKALTTTVEHGDRVLDDIGGIAATVRAGGALPGAIARSAAGALAALVSGLLRRRRRPRDERDDDGRA